MSTTHAPERCLLEAMAMLAALAPADFDRETDPQLWDAAVLRDLALAIHRKVAEAHELLDRPGTPAE